MKSLQRGEMHGGAVAVAAAALTGNAAKRSHRTAPTICTSCMHYHGTAPRKVTLRTVPAWADVCVAACTVACVLAVVAFIIAFVTLLTSSFRGWADDVRSAHSVADTTAAVLRAFRNERDVTYAALLLSHAFAASVLAAPPAPVRNGTGSFSPASLRNATAAWACLLNRRRVGPLVPYCDNVTAAHVWGEDAFVDPGALENTTHLWATIADAVSDAAATTDITLHNLVQSDATSCAAIADLLGIGQGPENCGPRVTSALLQSLPAIRTCNYAVLQTFFSSILPVLLTTPDFLSDEAMAILRNNTWQQLDAAAPSCARALLRLDSASANISHPSVPLVDALLAAGLTNALDRSQWLLSYQRSVDAFDGALSMLLQLMLATRLNSARAAAALTMESKSNARPLVLSSLTNAGQLLPYAATLAADMNRLEIEVSRLRGHVSAALFAGAFIDVADTFTTRGALYSTGKLLLPYLLTRETAGNNRQPVSPDPTWARRLRIGPDAGFVAELPADATLLYGAGTTAHAALASVLQDASSRANATPAPAASLSRDNGMSTHLTSEIAFIMNTTETLLRWRLFMSDLSVGTVILPPSEVEGFSWLLRLSGRDAPSNASAPGGFAVASRYLDETAIPMLGSVVAAPAKYYIVSSNVLQSLQRADAGVSALVRQQLASVDADAQFLNMLTVLVTVLLLACVAVGAVLARCLLRSQAQKLMRENAARVSVTFSSLSADRLRDPVNALVTVAEMLWENILLRGASTPGLGVPSGASEFDGGLVHQVQTRTEDLLRVPARVSSSVPSESLQSAPRTANTLSDSLMADHHSSRGAASRTRTGNDSINSAVVQVSRRPMPWHSNSSAAFGELRVATLDVDTQEQLELVHCLQMCANSLRALTRDVTDFAALFAGRPISTRASSWRVATAVSLTLEETARKLWLQLQRIATQSDSDARAPPADRRPALALRVGSSASASTSVRGSESSTQNRRSAVAFPASVIASAVGKESGTSFRVEDYCRLEIDEGVPSSILVDGDRVRQVLEVICSEIVAASPLVPDVSDDGVKEGCTPDVDVLHPRMTLDDGMHGSIAPLLLLRVGFRPEPVTAAETMAIGVPPGGASPTQPMFAGAAEGLGVSAAQVSVESRQQQFMQPGEDDLRPATNAPRPVSGIRQAPLRLAVVGLDTLSGSSFSVTRRRSIDRSQDAALRHTGIDGVLSGIARTGWRMLSGSRDPTPVDAMGSNLVGRDDTQGRATGSAATSSRWQSHRSAPAAGIQLPPGDSTVLNVRGSVAVKSDVGLLGQINVPSLQPNQHPPSPSIASDVASMKGPIPHNTAAHVAASTPGSLVLQLFIDPTVGARIVAKYVQRRRMNTRAIEPSSNSQTSLDGSAGSERAVKPESPRLLPESTHYASAELADIFEHHWHQSQHAGICHPPVGCGRLPCDVGASNTSSYGQVGPWPNTSSSDDQLVGAWNHADSSESREDTTMRLAQSLPFCGALVRALGGSIAMETCPEPDWTAVIQTGAIVTPLSERSTVDPTPPSSGNGTPAGVPPAHNFQQTIDPAAGGAFSHLGMPDLAHPAHPLVRAGGVSPTAVQDTSTMCDHARPFAEHNDRHVQQVATLDDVHVDVEPRAAIDAHGHDLTEGAHAPFAAQPFSTTSSAAPGSRWHRDSTINYGQPRHAGRNDAAAGIYSRRHTHAREHHGQAMPMRCARPAGELHGSLSALPAVQAAAESDLASPPSPAEPLSVRTPVRSTWYRIRIVVPCTAHTLGAGGDAQANASVATRTSVPASPVEVVATASASSSPVVASVIVPVAYATPSPAARPTRPPALPRSGDSSPARTMSSPAPACDAALAAVAAAPSTVTAPWSAPPAACKLAESSHVSAGARPELLAIRAVRVESHAPPATGVPIPPGPAQVGRESNVVMGVTELSSAAPEPAAIVAAAHAFPATIGSEQAPAFVGAPQALVAPPTPFRDDDVTASDNIKAPAAIQAADSIGVAPSSARLRDGLMSLDREVDITEDPGQPKNGRTVSVGRIARTSTCSDVSSSSGLGSEPATPMGASASSATLPSQGLDTVHRDASDWTVVSPRSVDSMRGTPSVRAGAAFMLDAIDAIGDVGSPQRTGFLTTHKPRTPPVVPLARRTQDAISHGPAVAVVAAARHVAGDRVRALVVDDDHVNRMLAVRILEQGCGLDAVALEHGDEVLPWCLRERSSGRRFAVILLDALVRRGSARAVIEQLRGAGFTDLPVLIMADDSSDFHNASADECRAMGFAGVLPKPLSRLTVKTVVTRLLAAGAAARAK